MNSDTNSTNPVREYRTDVEHDDCMDPPWDNEDLLGEVSDWTTRDKLPGELVLCSDHGHRRYYDFKGACEKALLQGWGFPGTEEMTPRQRASKAALADYERLRAWCNDDWNYVTVTVTEVREDAEGFRYDGPSTSLSGVESDSTEEYLDEIKRDLIAELEA